MIPLLFAVVGGYFIGDALKKKQIFAEGGIPAGYGLDDAQHYELAVNNVKSHNYKKYEDAKKDYDERSKNGEDVSIYSYNHGGSFHLIRNNSWAIVNDKNGEIVSIGYMSKDRANQDLPTIMKEKGDTNFSLKKIYKEITKVKYAEGGMMNDTGMMAHGGEIRYKLKGNNFGQQIESGQKFKSLISKTFENQSGENIYPENFIKEIAYTGKIVKSDGSNYLKDYSYKGTLTKFQFLDNKDFLESLKYLDRPSIKSLKFEQGGVMMAHGGNIDMELADFDLDNLDDFETFQFNHFLSSLGKAGALQVLINNVEGDYSQLSPELAELAEMQMGSYAKGGVMMDDGGDVEVDMEDDGVIRGFFDDEAYAYAKGGTLKEGDYVWNALGRKLIVDKVTDDEYLLVGFGQPSASPFGKKKVDDYIKNDEWSLKPKKSYAKGGVMEEYRIVPYKLLNDYLTYDYTKAFTVNGTKKEATEKAKMVLSETNPSADIFKVSGRKTKKVATV